MEKSQSFLDFLAAYIECALWSSTGEDTLPLDRKYCSESFEQESLTSMKADCRQFYAENNLDELDRERSRQAGHDFWLTRNRHGAGFWDGDWEEPQATLLTVAAHDFGNSDVLVGDDGKLYIYPLERRAMAMKY